MDKIAISAVEEINMDPISFYGIVKNDPDFMTSIGNRAWAQSKKADEDELMKMSGSYDGAAGFVQYAQ
jgi:hypothetical protein